MFILIRWNSRTIVWLCFHSYKRPSKRPRLLLQFPSEPFDWYNPRFRLSKQDPIWLGSYIWFIQRWWHFTRTTSHCRFCQTTIRSFEQGRNSLRTNDMDRWNISQLFHPRRQLQAYSSSYIQFWERNSDTRYFWQECSSISGFITLETFCKIRLTAPNLRRRLQRRHSSLSRTYIVVFHGRWQPHSTTNDKLPIHYTLYVKQFQLCWLQLHFWLSFAFSCVLYRWRRIKQWGRMGCIRAEKRRQMGLRIFHSISKPWTIYWLLLSYFPPQWWRLCKNLWRSFEMPSYQKL